MSPKKAYEWLLNSWKKKRMICPKCHVQCQFHDFHKNHVKEFHGIDSRIQCPFCFGNYSWTRGRKGDLVNQNHLHECCKLLKKSSFLKPEPLPSVSVPEIPTPSEESISNREAFTREFEKMLVSQDDGIPQRYGCLKCDKFREENSPGQMFDREWNPEYEASGFYSWNILEKPEWWQHSGMVLNGIPPEVFAYFHTFHSYDWFHLVVKAVTFDSFLKAMQHLQVAVLPFGCLCDGLNSKQNPEERHHRHLIMAVPKQWDEFDAAWKSIKLSGYKYCKSSRKIESKIHLLNSIFYVSQRRSKCNGFRIVDQPFKGGRLHHYYIQHPLNDHMVNWMSLLFPTGVQKRIQWMCQNIKVVKWLPYVRKVNDRHRNKRFVVPIKYMDLENCYAPMLPEGYECLSNPTDLKLWTFLESESWNFQMDSLNLGLDANKSWLYWVGTDHDYVLAKNQQKVMSQLKEVEEKYQEQMRERDLQVDELSWRLNQTENELNSKIECLETKLNESETESRSHKTKINCLETKLNQSETESRSHKTNIECLKTKLNESETESRSHKTNIECLKTKLSESENESQSRKTKINCLETKLSESENEITQHKTKIKHLENEITHHKAKINCLENEITQHKTKIECLENRILKLEAELKETKEKFERVLRENSLWKMRYNDLKDRHKSQFQF